MMRSKSSKDLSRGFQMNSEISFLISVRKVLPTSGQTVDLTKKKFDLQTKRALSKKNEVSLPLPWVCLPLSLPASHLGRWIVILRDLDPPIEPRSASRLTSLRTPRLPDGSSAPATSSMPRAPTAPSARLPDGQWRSLCVGVGVSRPRRVHEEALVPSIFSPRWTPVKKLDDPGPAAQHRHSL